MVGPKLGREAMVAGSGNPVPDIATAIRGYVEQYRSSAHGQARIAERREARNGKAGAR